MRSYRGTVLTFTLLVSVPAIALDAGRASEYPRAELERPLTLPASVSEVGLSAGYFSVGAFGIGLSAKHGIIDRLELAVATEIAIAPEVRWTHYVELRGSYLALDGSTVDLAPYLALPLVLIDRPLLRPVLGLEARLLVTDRLALLIDPAFVLFRSTLGRGLRFNFRAGLGFQVHEQLFARLDVLLLGIQSTSPAFVSHPGQSLPLSASVWLALTPQFDVFAGVMADAHQFNNTWILTVGSGLRF